MRIAAEHIDAARAVSIERIAEERSIKLRGRIERVGPCPRCGGTDRFSINIRKQLWNCRECQKGGDVIALVQHLDGVDFITAVNTLAGPIPGAKTKADGKDHPHASVQEFPYTDENGNVLFVVDRRNANGKAKKRIKQKRPDPDRPGEWLWNLAGIPLVPYRLPQLIEAIANDHPILIVEGEGKADLLSGWNVTATCNSGGAGKWKPEHSAYMRDADVVLVPDADDAGWQHVHQVGAFRVLVLPGLPEKGDIIDWHEAGGTREQLDALINDAPEWKPPTADETSKRQEEQKAKAKAKEDELLDALAKIEGLEYVRRRKEVADELEVSARDIDQVVKQRREDAQIAPLYGHWIVEPWPEPVEGDSLLRDIIRRFKRHVVMTDDYALTIALFMFWGAVHDEVATHSPILNINSAEPESGKSTTLGLVSFLLPKCIASVEASEAALYRAIKRWQPSFCFDEFDSILADDDKAALRSVINSGHVRGQGVLRCIGDDKTPELFPTFAPKVIGMVGRKLPPATLSRCIFIELRRRKKDERIEKFNHVDDDELRDLRRRLRRWALDNEDALRNAKPTMPDELQNRRADNWSLLIAIADLCSGPEDWGDRARAAALRIEGKADNRTDGVRMLADCRDLFDRDPRPHCMSSLDIVTTLCNDPEKPWATCNRGKALTQNRLAAMLRPYGITSQTVAPPGQKDAKGYYRHQFEEAWSCYL
jgi:putative DNA primase/helicase